MNVTELNNNDDFFRKLEIKPTPKELQKIVALPSVKVELKNIINENLEKNEQLNHFEIDKFIENMLTGNNEVKEIDKKLAFEPLVFTGEDNKVIKIKTKTKKIKRNDDVVDKQKKIKSTLKQITTNYISDNNLSTREFIEKIKETYENKSSISLDISPKYLYNKGLFQKSITDILKQYQLYSSQTLNSETCEERENVNENIFTPFNHQLLVKDYLNITTPYRGLMLYHGLGSGKTCTSIGVIEGFKYDKKVYILTPKSLQKNYKTQLQHCGDQIYKSSNFWYYKDVDRNDMGLINALQKLTGYPAKKIRRNKGLWLIDSTQKSNKDTLSKTELSQIKEQIIVCLENKYEFISYNGQLKTSKFFNKFTEGGEKNPFHHSVVVIDEAHNVISGIANKYSKKNSNTMKLYRLLKNAEDCRIILLTGTPIINYPNELGIMMNILRGFIKTLELKLEITTNDKINNIFFKTLFQKFPIIDYFDYNSKTHILSITKNPYGFVNTFDNEGESDGLILNENGNLTFEEFESRIVKFLANVKSPSNESKKLFKIVSKKQNDYDNLPDSLEEFESNFFDSSKKFINKEKLQRRIVGLVSHLGDKDKLMPEIISQNIVEVIMSDYQIPIYAKARSNEIKQEKQNKKKSKKNKILKELYEETTSTYRIFSRAFCNFVFPEDIERPLPKNNMQEVLNATKSDVIIDEDILDQIDDDIEGTNLEGKLDDVREDEKINDNVKRMYNQRIIRALDLLDERKDELLSEESLSQYSPKFLACLQNIKNNDYIGNHLLYSQFRSIEGIGIFKLVLEANGFVELKIRKKNIKQNNISNLDNDFSNIIGESKYVIDIPTDKWHLPKFALYTGTETDEEKELIRNIFNSDWENLPEPISSQVKRLGENNFYGNVCKLLMITSAGAEGINLKNVRYVHLMEPYWHPVRLEQVIGRARRICSHKDLPLELRNIETFLYISKLSDKHKKDQEYIELSVNDNNETSDETLLKITQRKDIINSTLLNILRETSIDCTLHKKSKDQECFRLPISDKSTFITKPDFKERSGETKTTEKEEEYKTFRIKGKKYIMYDDGQIINYEKYKQNKTIEIHGEHYQDKNGKPKIKIYKK